jgi:hypothetical protein
MTLAVFKASIANRRLPAGLSEPLVALWHDEAGDWDEAHRVAQDIDDDIGARIHAYLHRKEGDIGNAGYWYRRAGLSPFKGTLGEEWESLVTALLSESRASRPEPS